MLGDPVGSLLFGGTDGPDYLGTHVVNPKAKGIIAIKLECLD
jgi:hypothetical protein